MSLRKYKIYCMFFFFLKSSGWNGVRLSYIVNTMAATSLVTQDNPDSKVHWANMGPIWGRQDPGGPHVGPMNFAIWLYWFLHRNDQASGIM